MSILKNINFLSLNTKSYILVYLEGNYGEEYVKNLSFEGKIANYLFFNIRILILLSLLQLKLTNNNLKIFIYLMICITFLFLKFNTLFDRYFYTLIYVSLLNQKQIKCLKLKSWETLYYGSILFNNILLIIMLFRTQHMNILFSYEKILKYNILTIIYDFFKL